MMRNMYTTSRGLLLICWCLCLLALVGCGEAASASSSNRAVLSTTTSPALTPTVSPAQVESCPQAGSTRKAQMPPLTVSKHSALAYTVHMDGNFINVYDTVTKKTREILRAPGIIEDQSTLSPDGHWLSFVVSEGEGIPTSMLALTRIDGQHAQPLFCLQGRISYLHWSPDQKHIAFFGNDGEHGGIYLLDLLSGKLTLALPVTPIGTMDDAAAQQAYMPDAWLDNTHLALLGFSPGDSEYSPNTLRGNHIVSGYSSLSYLTNTPPSPPDCLYILDISKGAPQQLSDLRLAFKSNKQVSASAWSYTYTTNPLKLFVQQCSSISPAENSHFTCSVSMLSEAGALQSLFHTSVQYVRSIRMLTNTSLLFFVEHMSTLELWSINEDGTNLTKLSVPPLPLTGQQEYTREKWSMLSADSSDYVTMASGVGGPCGFGSLHGGALTPFVQDSIPSNNIHIVGWGEV